MMMFRCCYLFKPETRNDLCFAAEHDLGLVENRNSMFSNPGTSAICTLCIVILRLFLSNFEYERPINRYCLCVFVDHLLLDDNNSSKDISMKILVSIF